MVWAFVAAELGAQTEPAAPNHWSELMRGDQVNLQEARVQFEAQSHLRLESRSCGEKPFERWAWWMQERGGLEQAPDPFGWWEAAEDWRNAASQPASFPAVWSYLGPEAIPVHGGAGRVNRIRIDPNNANRWLACAPAGGLWQSLDAGETWSVMGVDVLSPLGATDVWMDPEDSAHMWLCTGDGNGGDTYSIGILETWDSGMSWGPLELSFEASQGRRVHTAQRHPNQPNAFLAASDLGVFKTSNGGTTFTLVLPGHARDVVWLSDSVALAAVENQGVFRSSDGGESWIECILPESLSSVGRIQLAAQAWGEADARDTVYAVGGHYYQQNFLAFWKSVDGGQTWTAPATRQTGPNLLGYTVNGADNGGQAFWDLCIEVDPQDATRVLVGGVNVWETLDGGTNWNCQVHWQGAFESKYAHADQHDIAFLPDGRVLLANDGGVFEWDGNAVTDKSDGLDIAQGYALGLHPTDPDKCILGTQDNGTNLLTPGFDARILDGDGFHGFFDVSAPGRLFASAYYGLLYRSEDGGRTMSNIANYYQGSGPNELGSWQTPFQLHPAVPGRIVAAKKSLHYSDDGGSSWSTVGGMGTVRATAMALSPSDPNVALIAKNNQLHWFGDLSAEAQQISGLPGDYIGDVAIDRDSSGVWWVSMASYEESAQMWRTSDFGVSWENVSTGLPQLPVHRVIQLPGDLWACASELGVHIWNGEAQAWESWGTGMPLTPVVDLAVDTLQNRLVASTYGRGVWTAPLPDAPEHHVTVTQLLAPVTQCMNQLTGSPEIRISGHAPVEAAGYEVRASRDGSSEVVDTVWTAFAEPQLPATKVVLDAFALDVPESGDWSIEITPLLDGSEGLVTLQTTLWASGLGHTTTLQWWGDCESVDMRWALLDSEESVLLLQSTPLWAGDTLTQTWCLSEGCYEVLWEDSGDDGFSGSYCGEGGGYRIFGPLGDVLSESISEDFGSSLTVPFCVTLPWCYADYDGDGERAVSDLLTVLAEYGCSSDCFTDNSLDGYVGVNDLMNMLSVFGSGCSSED